MTKKNENQDAVKDASNVEETQQPTEQGETVLIVTTTIDGFRRGGRTWSGTTEVLASEFTDEQLEQILTEPKLCVQVKD